MRKSLPIGTKVHYDSDNKEWGERIVGNGVVMEYRQGKYVVNSETHRAIILFRRNELSIREDMNAADKLAFVITCEQDFDKWWKEHSVTYIDEGVDRSAAKRIFEVGYEAALLRVKE